jgi:hypothetical protein
VDWEPHRPRRRDRRKRKPYPRAALRLKGRRGSLLASSLNYPGRHPDLVAREDAHLGGIYALLKIIAAKIAPEAELPQDIAPLSASWLLDVHALHTLQLHELEKLKEEIESQ